jgi:DsbC/DsbD-like thiol-disulfide interchange protein
VAPIVDFSKSRNLGAVDISFPVPEREDDGFAVTNIYMDRVVLPFTAGVIDRTKPVDVAAALTIGVCDEICVPEDVAATVAVPAGEHDASASEMLVTAKTLIPGAPLPGEFSIDTVVRVGGTDGKPVFRFEGVVPDAANAVIFVEGPADWSPYTPKFVTGEAGRAAYTVEFSRRGSQIPIAGARFRLTVQSAGRAIDQTVALD